MARPSFAACLAVLAAACGGSDGPTPPGGSLATVRITYLAPTAARTDLPASAQACRQAVGVTHAHPSWRGFPGIPLQPAVSGDRWDVTFTDVPAGIRQSFRINDPNACDENPTGAVTRNVFANDVRLSDMVTTPGSGPEPGFAFTVAADGTVTP